MYFVFLMTARNTEVIVMNDGVFCIS